jgi:hypothetical protein
MAISRHCAPLQRLGSECRLNGHEAMRESLAPWAWLPRNPPEKSPKSKDAAQTAFHSGQQNFAKNASANRISPKTRIKSPWKGATRRWGSDDGREVCVPKTTFSRRGMPALGMVMVLCTRPVARASRFLSDSGKFLSISCSA